MTAMTNIVTLYESGDRTLRAGLDRYLTQLSKKDGVQIWNDEQILPGEDAAAVLQMRLREADLVLMLVSQNFIASSVCYAQAEEVFQMQQTQPQKRIVVVQLRPSSIEDTPFQSCTRLPAPDLYITQYKDPEQGYWDTYQGIKQILDPLHRYKKRPKIAIGRNAFAMGSILLLWGLFALFLPFFYPQKGIRIVPQPFRGAADSCLYYKLYKLDGAVQKNVMLSFSVAPEDTSTYGQLYPFSQLIKVDNAEWSVTQAHPVTPHPVQMIEDRDIYFSQCVVADFNENDEGEYHYSVEFSRPIGHDRLRSLQKRLLCSHAPCSISESNCANVAYFSPFHYLYFRKTRIFAAFSVLVLISLLVLLFFNIKKAAAYATV